MNYLITGGTGFIGSFVARQLIEQGEKVIAYDLAPDLTLLERLMGRERIEAITVVRGDILDLAHLARTARRHQADRVIHLAYYLGRDTEFNPTIATRINCEGTNNAFETAAIAGIRRVVWASSVAVFGPKSATAGEVVANDAPFDPLNIYGACKAVNEMVARRYAHSYGLEPVGLRFPVVYGPGAARGWAGFLTTLIENLARGLPASAPRSEELVNWGYVEDIAEAILLAAVAPSPHTLIYNLSGDTKSVREAVEMVLGHFPGSEVGMPPRYTELRLPARLDDRAAREELGWQPHYPVEAGVRETAAFYRRVYG